MATLGTSYNTLADLANATEPDGSISREIADRTARSNKLMTVLPWRQGNKMDGNQVVQRTALPTVGYIKYNLAPTKSKGARVQMTDNVGVIKNFSDVDVELINAQTDGEGFRKDEDMAFVEAMNQQAASDMVYGSTVTTPEKFNGLAQKYGVVNTTRNNPGYYMLNAGGTGSDNTSIWVCAVGSDGLYGIYGKEGKAGLSMKDHGKVWGPDSAGNDMQWYRSEFRWELGLQVRRPGAVVRICNVDVSALVAASSAANLVRFLQRALYLIEPGLGSIVILANKTVLAHMTTQAIEKSTLGLNSAKDTNGERILDFWGHPLLQMDTITNAEATIAGTFQSTI